MNTVVSGVTRSSGLFEICCSAIESSFARNRYVGSFGAEETDWAVVLSISRVKDSSRAELSSRARD